MEEQWPTFLCEYDHNGETWSLEIIARDEADARARLASLGNPDRLRLVGVLCERIPVVIGE